VSAAKKTDLTPSQERRKATRGLSHEVTFGKAYDARLVKRLAVFFKPHFGLFLLALCSYPIVSGLHLAQPYLVKVAIDSHIMPKQMQGFLMIVVLLVAAIILEFIAKFVQTMLTQFLGQRVTRDLRGRLFEKLQEVDLSYIEKNPVGRLMTRVTNDVESLTETFSTGAISIIGDIVTLTGIVIMMLALDWKLTIYAFCTMPILGAFVQFMQRYAREAFREVRTLLSRLNAFLNEAISGMSLIQSFGQEATMKDEFEEVNGAYRDANLRSIRYDAMTYAVTEGLSTIAMALVLLLGMSLFESGAVKIGVLVAFVDYLRRFFAPINELSTKYTVLQSAMASAERCVDLLDQEPSVIEPDVPARPGPMQHGLQFEDVVFRYNAAGPAVLGGLSLSVAKGEKVAIVGPTGAGKSTVVKLVARFYDPTEGRVSLDGVDLKDLRLDDLRSRLAVVLQDPYLFEGSIEDNVRFGDANLPQAQLDAAAERTRAIDVLKRHEGWQTPVGERGSKLSAGERQLISFARALALDPEILVLDEATSSVDPETEGLIQKGLDALLENRSAIVIAHRLSTIRKVDRIVVLSKGQVVEEGSHDELLAKNGVYKNLYELQFAPEADEGPSSAAPVLQPA